MLIQKKNKDLFASAKKMMLVIRDSLEGEIVELSGKLQQNNKTEFVMVVNKLKENFNSIFPNKPDVLDYQRREKTEVTDICILSEAAEDLKEITRQWILVREAFKYDIPDWEIIAKDIDALKAIEYGNTLVKELFKLNEWNLETDIVLSPRVVPFMEKMYATGFNYPTPFIVSPVWGFQQMWSWFGYAHELGHHIYRNIKGLKDELRVHVMGSLSLNSIDYDMQKVWFNWLEEIFADIFGILQLGMGYVNTQQYTFLCLPMNAIKLFKTKLKDFDDTSRNNSIFLEALKYDTDSTHPIPYVRHRLAIKALCKLVQYASINNDKSGDYWNKLDKDDDLNLDYWKDVFTKAGISTDLVKLTMDVTFPHPLPVISGQAYVDKDIKDIEKIEDILIDSMLDTKLYSLAAKDGNPRSASEVFIDNLNRADIDKAGVLIKNPTNDSVGINIQHILIAAQEKLEKMLIDGESVDEISVFNNKVLKIIGQICKI